MKKIVPAPYIDQTERWVNGCESISSVMLLQAVGIDIDPDTFIARDLPHAPYWEQDGKLYGPDPWQVYPGVLHGALQMVYCIGATSGIQRIAIRQKRLGSETAKQIRSEEHTSELQSH